MKIRGDQFCLMTTSAVWLKCEFNFGYSSNSILKHENFIFVVVWWYFTLLSILYILLLSFVGVLGENSYNWGVGLYVRIYILNIYIHIYRFIFVLITVFFKEGCACLALMATALGWVCINCITRFLCWHIFWVVHPKSLLMYEYVYMFLCEMRHLLLTVSIIFLKHVHMFHYMLRPFTFSLSHLYLKSEIIFICVSLHIYVGDQLLPTV